MILFRNLRKQKDNLSIESIKDFRVKFHKNFEIFNKIFIINYNIFFFLVLYLKFAISNKQIFTYNIIV